MKSASPRVLIFFLLGTLLAPAALAAEPAPMPAPLTAPGHTLLATSVRFGDALWDDRAALLWTSATPTAGTSRHHAARETTWYVLGLMLRDAPGDRARASRTRHHSRPADQRPGSAVGWHVLSLPRRTAAGAVLPALV